MARRPGRAAGHLLTTQEALRPAGTPAGQGLSGGGIRVKVSQRRPAKGQKGWEDDDPPESTRKRVGVRQRAGNGERPARGQGASGAQGGLVGSAGGAQGEPLRALARLPGE